MKTLSGKIIHRDTVARKTTYKKKHTLHPHTHTHIYIIQIQQSEKIRARMKKGEHSRISSKSRILHEFVSCTISLISSTSIILTNHYPTLPFAIDKNVTVRFYSQPPPRVLYPFPDNFILPLLFSKFTTSFPLLSSSRLWC